jgi:two-component system, OmpR family, response regulator VanR
MNMLFLEDDSTIADCIKLCLKVLYPHSQIDCLGRADTALHFIQSGLYDCVLIDLDFPNFDGLAVITTLSHAYQIPVLTLSNLEEPEAAVMAASLGVDGFITKPFKYHVLLERINRAIKVHRLTTCAGCLP